MNTTSLLIALYALGYATPVMARGFGEALIEISVRASLQTTSELMSRATTAGTSPDDCHRHGRFHECMRLDPDTAALLVREAFSQDGPTLREFAAAMATRPETLAAAIVGRMPDEPTRDELERLLAIVGPGLAG